MSNNDYVIFIKKKRGDFEPVDSAETKDEGIEVAEAYLENPKVLEAEVVYMPNDDYDVEEVVWNSSKNVDESNKENTGAEQDSARQAVTEVYNIKHGYGDVVKSFDALEDAVKYINDGMKNKESEHFVLYNDDKEMIWLDNYRDGNFSEVGYTVSRHNDKSVEFDKAAKVLKVKKEEVKLEDNKVMHDVINSSLAKIKAYDAMQAVFKFRFVDSRKKPTKVDFENKIVFYDDYADRAKIAQDIAKQYKEYKKSVANKWYDVDDNLVEAVGDDVIHTKDDGSYLTYKNAGNYIAFNKYNVYIGRIKADSKEEAIAEFTKKEPKYEALDEGVIKELFGFGKKKEKKNLYIMAMFRDSSRRIATADLWDDLYWKVKKVASNVKSSSRNYFTSRVLEQCEFVTTEKEFNRLKSDIERFVRYLPSRYYVGVDTVNYDGEINSDIKRSTADLIEFECIKRDIKESLEESEDSAWSEEEVRAELIKMTNNFKKNEGEITTWYEEEKDHIKNILDAASYQVEVSDGRKDKDDDMHWVITFVKKVNESLTENPDVKIALELIDNDEDNMVAAYKVSSGKDALSLAVETIGYTNGTNEPGLKVSKEDIKKLEIVSGLSEDADITDVFIDIDDNKDLIYCGKFNSSDYTDINKIIKVIEDWSKGTNIEESLKNDNSLIESKQYTTSELISSSLDHFGGDLGYDIYNMDIEELTDKVIKDIQNNYNLDYSFEPETNDIKEYSKWYDSIEAEVLKQLKDDQLKEDTNINIDKVEIDIDTLNTKTKKIDEELAFDKDKKLTIREMYDFLLKSGMANGCDIILDWDNDSDLSNPKTAIEWLDLIIETYYDLDSDLRYMNADDEAERNMDRVIIPLEDFRNELNEKGLAQLNNIYYQVLSYSYNNDSGDDDFDDYDNYGAAETAFENKVNAYKKDSVDGAVELFQVNDNKRTSKQLKYWSSEDDNAWRFDESLSDSCCDYQTAYEKLDKFMSDSEEDTYKFYEARTKEDLIDALENAIVDEDRFLSYAGEDATLEGFAEYILDNKLNESLQEEETVKDYGCDMCGKRVPEDQIFWFYGGEIGLCEECFDETSTYVRTRLDDGDFSFLDKEY